MTMLLPRHLLIDRHQSGTVEWKAMFLDAGSPGCPVTLLGFTSFPPVAPSRRHRLPLRTPLYEKRQGNQKDWKRLENFNGLGDCGCDFFSVGLFIL